MESLLLASLEPSGQSPSPDPPGRKPSKAIFADNLKPHKTPPKLGSAQQAELEEKEVRPISPVDFMDPNIKRKMSFTMQPFDVEALHGTSSQEGEEKKEDKKKGGERQP